jgi:hypothetical protein
MSTEFNFVVMDANQLVEAQQTTVREMVTKRLGLEGFRRADKPRGIRPLARPARRIEREEEPVE